MIREDNTLEWQETAEQKRMTQRRIIQRRERARRRKRKVWRIRGLLLLFGCLLFLGGVRRFRQNPIQRYAKANGISMDHYYTTVPDPNTQKIRHNDRICASYVHIQTRMFLYSSKTDKAFHKPCWQLRKPPSDRVFSHSPNPGRHLFLVSIFPHNLRTTTPDKHTKQDTCQLHHLSHRQEADI